MLKNFLKKYFTAIFLVFFLLIFSIFYGKDYLDFYNNAQKIDTEKELIDQKLQNFSLDKIRNLEQVDFYYTPYEKLLDDIISKISSAEKRVYIEVYMLTKNSIKDAIIKAEKRGVDVKVLLEKNPYMSYNINDKTYELFDKSGVFTQWSNPINFALNHSKMLIIDDEIIISTGNLTHSTFFYNRDFFLFIKDKIILEKMLDLFNSDFNGNDIYVYDENLVISPLYSREKFEILISSSKKTIDIYFQYLKDEKLFNLLIEKIKKGSKLNIILAESALEDNSEEIEKLKDLGAKVKLIKKPKMHSKAILIDDKYLFIGSINFSNYSLDKNREVGIILKNQEVINKFKEVFKKDFGI